MDGGGNSSQPTSQTVTQTNLPEYVRPYYEQVLGQGAALTDINAHPYQQYQGNRVAGFAPMQQQAFSQLQNMQLPGQTTDASNLTSGIASQALQYQGYQPGQFETDRFTDPGMAASYMSPYIQNALDPVMSQMQRTSDLRQRDLSGQAQQAGAFGGYRQGLQLAEEQRNTQKNMGDVYSQGLQSAYGAANQSYLADRARMQQAQQLAEQSRQFGSNLGLQGLNTSLAAAGQLGQLGQQQYAQQMGLNQAQQMAGAQQQALQQQQLNTSYNDFLAQQNWPYRNLSFMSELIGRPMTNSTQSMYAAPPSQSQSLMGLGIGAYGLSGLLNRKGGGRIRGFARGGVPAAMLQQRDRFGRAQQMAHAQQAGLPSLPPPMPSAQAAPSMQQMASAQVAPPSMQQMANAQAVPQMSSVRAPSMPQVPAAQPSTGGLNPMQQMASMQQAASRFTEGGVPEAGLPEGWDWFTSGPEIRPQLPPVLMPDMTNAPQYALPAWGQPHTYDRPAGLPSLPAATPPALPPALASNVASTEAPAASAAVAPVAAPIPAPDLASGSAGADAEGGASPGTGATGDGDPGEKRGGVIHRAAGGIMGTINTLGKMPPPYLDRMAKQGKYQPFSGLMQLHNNQLQTAAPTPADAALPPMDQGLASTDADPMTGFKDGGIVGYAGGDVIEDSPLETAMQYGIEALKQAPSTAASLSPFGLFLTPTVEIGKKVPQLYDWLTKPRKTMKDVPVNRAIRADTAGTGTDLGWSPSMMAQGPAESTPPGKSPTKAAREAAQQKAEATGYTPGAFNMGAPRTAKGVYDELQGLEGLAKENNPMYGRRNELAGKYAAETGKDIYADAIAAGKAILDSPYRGKGSGLAALTSGVLAGGTSQLVRDKETLAREERLLALDTALREGDLKKAQHIQDQVQKDDEKRLLAQTSAYHTQESAKTSVYAADTHARAAIEQARLHLAGSLATAKSTEEYRQTSMRLKAFDMAQAKAEAHVANMYKNKGLDLDSNKESYDADVLRMTQRLVPQYIQLLGGKGIESLGAQKDPRIIDTPPDGNVRTR